MKYRFTTARIVVLIAMVNLVVAVAVLAMQPLGRVNPYDYSLMVVFCLLTSPLLTFIGAPIITSTSMWVIPAFLLLLVLNAFIWGVVGAYGAILCGWLYRLLWIEPDGVVLSDKNNLKWDVLFVVFTHAILLAVLAGLLCTLIPISFEALGEFSGTLPFSAQILWKTSIYFGHPLVDILLVIGFLYLDGRNYMWLCRTRGKKAATIWAISVTAVILVAIVWYTSLALILLNTVIHWRLR